jgi:hypothetical protein
MRAKESSAPRWGRLGVGLVAVLIVLGSLAMAAGVLGKPRPTIIKDPRGDGGGVQGHDHPGFCDVLQASSKLAKRGRVRHTVTTRGPIPDRFSAPPVLIKAHWVRDQIGLYRFLLSPGEPGVKTHFTNGRRTVVYFAKRRTIKAAVKRGDKYYWVVDQCPFHDDRAPDRGAPSQVLERHHHHRHN